MLKFVTSGIATSPHGVTCLTEPDSDTLGSLIRHEPELAARINELTRDILRIQSRSHKKNLMICHDGEFPLLVIREIASVPQTLMLIGNPLRLSREVVEAIAKRMGGTWIQGLEKITPELAKVFSHFFGRLDFESPMALSLVAARKLIKRQGHLGLCLKRCASPMAKVLAQSGGSLHLQLMQPLMPPAARFLAEHRHTLFVHQPRLTLSVANELVHHQGGSLFLYLTALKPAIARDLVAYQGQLGFGLAGSLSVESAAILSEHRGGLQLAHVGKISPAAMRHLANIQGDLEIKDAIMTDELCEILADHKGKLTIAIDQPLSPTGATAILRHAGAVTIKIKTTDRGGIWTWLEILGNRPDIKIIHPNIT